MNIFIKDDSDKWVVLENTVSTQCAPPFPALSSGEEGGRGGEEGRGGRWGEPTSKFKKRGGDW